MNVESLFGYGLAVVCGWLLRQYGVGAGIKTPGVSPPTAGGNRVPVMATLKTDIDQIVKSAVEEAVKQAIDDIKSAAVPANARQPS